MTAEAMTDEEEAGANESPFMILKSMIVVLSLEIGHKAIESHSTLFLGIPLGLFYLTNHARVHTCSFATV
jgi:hypothetical protein